MPSYPCKQHSDFKSAKHRQKHINLLLLDGSEEFHRTYGPDGKPLQPFVLPGERSGVQTPAQVAEHGQFRSGHQLAPKRYWASAYVEGGQQASDLAKQVGSKRSPTGNFLGLVNPGVARTVATSGQLPNMRRDALSTVRAGTPDRLPWADSQTEG
jgi:hypothetical protein